MIWADVVLKVQSVWQGISCGVAGEGIRSPILHPRDVHHRKSIAEGLLPQVSQTDVADIERAVAKDLQKVQRLW